jgi:hypothetical protein
MNSKDLILTIKNSLPVVQGLDDDTKAVAGSISGGKRISIKGGAFRKFVGGKQVSVIEGRKMNLIFVKMAHNPSRSYYSEGYKEGEKVAPSCWSNDSKVPDAEVKNPIAKTCEQCPMSIKGSAANGQGSACRLQWRTAVVLPHDPSGDVMQLVLPPTSVFGKEADGKWPFRAYVQMLASNNISASRVITEASFDINSPVPKLQFTPIAAVPEDVLSDIVEQSKSQEAERAIKLNVYQQDGGDDESEEVVEASAPVEDKPVLRESPKQEVTIDDVPDVLKKWGKKGK